jgi:hypothetical protein
MIGLSASNELKKKVLFGQDSSEHSSTLSGINQIVLTNNEDEEMCTYDTIDALPHIDHYRNLFSFTSSEPKSRPTLEVLHGTANLPSKFRLASTLDLNEMVSSVMIHNEQTSQIEIKPKVKIVKFGWIIGVLVCFIFSISMEYFL